MYTSGIPTQHIQTRWSNMYNTSHRSFLFRGCYITQEEAENTGLYRTRKRAPYNEQIHRMVAEPATAMARNMTWPRASSIQLTSWLHTPLSTSLIHFATSPTELFHNHKFCTCLLIHPTALQVWPIATLDVLHGVPSGRDRKVAGSQQGVVLQDVGVGTATLTLPTF
jgi:hypothetical protein